ncbi:MAG: precorrin-8X methylmutase [Desulfobacteraceae bacterium]|nr:precorrin-8X methylmutase [Desulfobacteraceae bacterium]
MKPPKSKPQGIEDSSFKIIDNEAGEHGFDSNKWQIIRRMIHTSADFEYIETVRFHKKAIAAGIKALKKGCSIFTDTNMAKAGIRNRAECFIKDDDVVKIASANNLTRAEVAVDKAVGLMDHGMDQSIYVIGNAPTALLHLIDLVKEGKATPALIVGFPVGFVNAAESKHDLIKMDYPYISNIGRKGGSNIAASVVNALIILAERR